jgi:protocatechuate 3,4-dioxygenase beta subunit
MTRTRIACALFFVFVALASVAAQKNQTQLRTVRGTVVDKQDTPVSAAIVYLENRKTKVIRTALSDDHGLYRFSGLDPNVDFEIHAELNGATSSNRTISTFDTRNEIEMTLKLDKKKGEK